jgi:hypothetical protein
MLRAFLIEATSSRGPYDDDPTVTQGVLVYNLTHNELDFQALTYTVKRAALEHFSFSIVLRLALI